MSLSGYQTVSAAGISLTLDLGVGHIHRLAVAHGGRVIEPLHRAPWIDDPVVAADPAIPPNVKRLAGDFFCAPFGLSNVEPAPTHGWPANSAWRLVNERPAEPNHSSTGRTASFELARRVMGARLLKQLTLRDGHPFVYQAHTFEGGEGALTAAHHTMVRLPQGGALSFSPKAYAELPPTALESDPARGRSILRYPARTEDLRTIPLADGSVADLHDYPFAERHEDFFMLVEKRSNAHAAERMGWTAVLDPHAAQVVLVLKDPASLPVTLLWLSNGGRSYAPWNGRHTAVIGIEDARCWSLFGHAASIADNPLARSGVPTAFVLARGHATCVRQVIGATPIPSGWSRIVDVEPGAGVLFIRDVSGATLALPFDDGFLARSDR